MIKKGQVWKNNNTDREVMINCLDDHVCATNGTKGGVSYDYKDGNGFGHCILESMGKPYFTEHYTFVRDE
jgi:hypothetical protein